MSRLRRLVLADRYFFVTCNLLRTRAVLDEDDFEILARVMQARREEHGFLLTAWVFLPDHWHAILGPRYLKGLSRVTSDGGLILVRELDERLGFGELMEQHLTSGVNLGFARAKGHGKEIAHRGYPPVLELGAIDGGSLRGC